MFQGWENYLDDHIEVVSVQLPGRANRLREPLIKSMSEVMSHLETEIQTLLDKPFVLIGHSLGSRIAFEVLCFLEREGLRLPEHFVAAGSAGPHIPAFSKKTYDLSDNEFLEEIKKMGGTSDEFFNSPELLELYLPPLRADFQVAETHISESKHEFDMPVSVFGGKLDHDIALDDLKTWGRHFKLDLDIHLFPGNHFFIDTHKVSVLQRLGLILEDTLQVLD